jgi:membrane protein DedA with SNARE-associated domain
MIHFHSFLSYIDHFKDLSYKGIFLAILASGHVVPIPELVMLILLGYLAALGKYSIWKVFAAAIFTTAIVDIVIYFVCLGGSELITKFSKRLNAGLTARYLNAEEKHLFGLVFASHFVPGWRFANPFIAGITQMPWKKFTLYTIISSIIYAPLFIAIGFFFHTRIVPLLAAVESIRHILLWALIIGVVVVLAIIYNKDHAEK